MEHLCLHIYAGRVILGRLLPLHSQKEDQIRYDELVNHEGVYDGRHLKLKAHSKPQRPRRQQQHFYIFHENETSRISRQPNFRVPCLRLYSRAKQLHRNRKEMLGKDLRSQGWTHRRPMVRPPPNRHGGSLVLPIGDGLSSFRLDHSNHIGPSLSAHSFTKAYQGVGLTAQSDPELLYWKVFFSRPCH